MTTSRTISAFVASRSRYRPSSTAVTRARLAQPVIEGDKIYIVKDAPRKSESFYPSSFCGRMQSNLHQLLASSVPSLLNVNLTRSFSTTRDVDNLYPHHSNFPRTSASPNTSSNFDNPPEPIPNRPLRGARRAADHPPDRQQIRTQTRFGENERHARHQTEHMNAPREGGAIEESDFLEKFKLGFDRNKGENPNTKQSSYTSLKGGEKHDQAAIDSAPAPQPPPEEADEIFRKMKETGLIPNAVAMLDGLCKDGLVQEAMKLFGLMREKGSIPEVVIYTAVVEGFCKAQKPDDAIRIFRKMQSVGITPNAFSYGVLIQGLFRVKRLDDATEFCVEMLGAGHSPNVQTFMGLVDGYCREKGLEEARTMINSLRQKGFCLNEKAVREYLEKRGPVLPLVWEAIFGNKSSERSSIFS